MEVEEAAGQSAPALSSRGSDAEPCTAGHSNDEDRLGLSRRSAHCSSTDGGRRQGGGASRGTWINTLAESRGTNQRHGTPTSGVKRSELNRVLQSDMIKGVQTEKANEILSQVVTKTHAQISSITPAPGRDALNATLLCLAQPYALMALGILAAVVAVSLSDTSQDDFEWRVVEATAIACVLALHLMLDVTLSVRRSRDLFRKFTRVVRGPRLFSGNVEGLAGLRGADSCRILSVFRNSEDPLESVLLSRELCFNSFAPSDGGSLQCTQAVESVRIEPVEAQQHDVAFTCEIYLESSLRIPSHIIVDACMSDQRRTKFVASLRGSNIAWQPHTWITVEVQAEVETTADTRGPTTRRHPRGSADPAEESRSFGAFMVVLGPPQPQPQQQQQQGGGVGRKGSSPDASMPDVAAASADALEGSGTHPRVMLRRVSIFHSKWRWHSLPEALTVGDLDSAYDTGKWRPFRVREQILRKCLMSLFTASPALLAQQLMSPALSAVGACTNRSFGSNGDMGSLSTITQPQFLASAGTPGGANSPAGASGTAAPKFTRLAAGRFASAASAPDLISGTGAVTTPARGAHTPEDTVLPAASSPYLSPTDSRRPARSMVQGGSQPPYLGGTVRSSAHLRFDSTDAFDGASAGSDTGRDDANSISSAEEEEGSAAGENLAGQASGTSRPTSSQSLLFMVQRWMAFLGLVMVAVVSLTNVVRVSVSDSMSHLSSHYLYLQAPVGIVFATLPFGATIVLRILDCYSNSCLRSMIDMQDTSLRVMRSKRGAHTVDVESVAEESSPSSGVSFTSSEDTDSDVGGGDIFGSVDEGHLMFGCYNGNLSGREPPSHECEQTGIHFETLSHPSINRRMIFRHMWATVTNDTTQQKNQQWWSGTYDLVYSRNACQILGSLTVLACVDKAGILSEVVPVPEKVLVMKRKDKQAAPAPGSAAATGGEAFGGEDGARSDGAGVQRRRKPGSLARVMTPRPGESGDDASGECDDDAPGTDGGSSGYRASPATVGPTPSPGHKAQDADQMLSPDGAAGRVRMNSTAESSNGKKEETMRKSRSLESSMGRPRSSSSDDGRQDDSDATAVVHDRVTSDSETAAATQEAGEQQQQNYAQQKYHDMAFLTLEMHKDVSAENLLQFADSDWTKHLPQLKPLGLTASLHCLQYLEEEVAGITAPRSGATAGHSRGRKDSRRRRYPQTSAHMREQLHFDDTILWGKYLYFLGKEIGFSERLLTASGYRVKKRIHTLRPMERLRRKKRSGPETYTTTTNYDPTLDGRQQMASLVVIDPEGQWQLLSIGAPQFILEYTTDYWNGEEVLPLTSTDRKELQYCSNEWRRQRDLVTVAFAYRPLPPQYTEFLKQDMSGEAIHILESNEGQRYRAGPAGFTSGDDGNGSMDDSDESYDEGLHTLRGLTHEQIYQRLQKKQIFIGMVGSRSPPKDMVQDAITEFSKAGIRFIHFNPGNERMTKAFGEKLGLWTTANDWNCCISLKKDAAVGFSSIKARLPSGIKEIRQHLVSTDNVPLLVPLFCDSRPVATKKMIGILQENYEVVGCIGSCLNHTSTSSFFQADVGIATMPTCNTVLMHRNRSLTASRLTLFGLPGCPIGKELQGSELDKVHATFQKSLRDLYSLGSLLSLPAAVRLAPTEYPLYLLLCLVKQARLQLHCALKVAEAVVSWSLCWSMLFFAGSLAALPPILGLLQLMMQLFIIIPCLALALNEPFESLMCKRVTTILPKKNDMQEQWNVLKHLALHWVVRYLPTTIAIGAVYIWTLSHALGVGVKDLLPVSGETMRAKGYDTSLRYSQHIVVVCATMFFAAHSIGCLSRHLRIKLFQFVETDTGKKRPQFAPLRRKLAGEYYNPLEFEFFVTMTAVAVCLQFGISILALYVVTEEDGTSIDGSRHPKWLPIPVICYCFVIIVVDDLNKIWRKQQYLDRQVWRKFQFDTRLGMHSPRGDDHGDEDKGALKEAKKTSKTYWDFGRSFSL